MKGLESLSWNAILSSGWLKYVIGGAVGLTASAISSLAPDALWLHDNRQAVSLLLANQPLIQRDIGDLKNGLGELNLTIKELTIEMQKRRTDEAIPKGKRR